MEKMSAKELMQKLVLIIKEFQDKAFRILFLLQRAL